MSIYYTKAEVDKMLLEKLNREELDSNYFVLENNKLTLPDKCIDNSKLNPQIKSYEIPSTTEATHNKLATEYASAEALEDKVKKTDIVTPESSDYSSWKNSLLEEI